MSVDFAQNLQTYAELIVKVGLNLQPGQRLVIGNFLDFGVPIQAAPLVRQIAKAAYTVGTRFVDVLWGDDQLQLIRFQQAPRDSFADYPAWQASGALEYVQRGDALLIIYANDPDLLNDQDPELVATMQQAANRHSQPILDYFARNAMNWSVISAAIPGWAAKVFPNLAPAEQMNRLWEAIFATCRLHQADPIAAWQEHADQLAVRADYLNRKRYIALKYRAPGTDLTIGLPKAHLWQGSGRFKSQAGIAFTPNLPTEEVFTLPQKDQTEGVVKASMPLSYGGALIENFSLTFAAGRVVKVAASKGEAVLRKLVASGEGAGQLGEVSLVPHSSPIAQSGLLFYNTLFDENAASHIALGQGGKFGLVGGEAMSDEEFAAAGGNQSLMHVDFMIGSDEMDVDGVTGDGAAEPVMRRGEWAFTV